jgi:hypothetical protein
LPTRERQPTDDALPARQSSPFIRIRNVLKLRHEAIYGHELEIPGAQPEIRLLNHWR